MRLPLKKKYVICGVIFLSILCVVTFGFTYAKYVSNSLWNYYLGSKGFYFASDSLGMESIEHVNNLWDGKSVHFSLTNSENELVATDYNIPYQVSCTVLGDDASLYSCSINGTNSNTYTGTLSGYEACVNYKNDGIDVSDYIQSECEVNGYTWEKEPALADLYFDVSKNDGTEITDVTVEITAKSTSPYEKTLRGTYELHRDLTLDGSVSLAYDYDEFVGNLLVTNSFSQEKCVTITWNANDLRIDSNQGFNQFTEDAKGYINGITFKINGKSTVPLTFYQTDFDKVMDTSSFQIIESTNCQNQTKRIAKLFLL